MKFKAVLFDLDGTLTDPYEGITRSVQHSLRYYGIEREQETLKAFIGPPLTESYEKYFGFTHEQAVEAVEHYREHFAVKGLFENEVYPGIPELLAHLKNAGMKILLATSKPHVFAVRILEKFGLAPYFDAVAGSELDGGRVKKADVIRYLYENGAIGKNDPAVMVGDRLHDVDGAHECGLPCIGVLYGYGSREEMEEHHADYIAATVAELEELLLK